MQLLHNKALISGKAKSIKTLAAQHHVSDRYISHLLELAFLSPNIIERIFKGDIPHDLTLGKLKTHIPLNWDAQETLFS